MPRKRKYFDREVRIVKSAERTLDILILLANHLNGLQLKEMAQEMGIPVSSMYAILNTMKLRGFVEREEGSFLYRLGRVFYQLTNFIAPQDDLVSLALPIMDDVQHACNETIGLSVRIGDEIVFIGKRSSSTVIQVVNALGSRLPAHGTGSGKVMLAYLPEEDIDHIYPNEELPRLTQNTITSKTELKKELDRIRQVGFAYDYEESIDGVWAVAGCIHDKEGRPIAATSIVVPAFRVTEKTALAWRELIIEGAARISSKLGEIATLQDRLGRTI